jgi:hypothetical protein
MKRRQLHFLSPTYLRHRTGFHSNSLGNLQRFLVFYSSPLFAGFENPYLAIPNLAHLFLRKDRQKPNKLNSCAQKLSVLRTFYARALNMPKSAQQAYGYLLYSYSLF